MGNVIVLLIILVVAYWVIKSYLSKQQEASALRMQAIYTRMESFVIQERLTLNNDLKEFLMSVKTIVVNPDFVDFRVMVKMSQILKDLDINHDEISDKFNERRTKLPQGLLDLEKEFKAEASRYTKWSTFSIQLVFIIFTVVIVNIFVHGVASLKRVFRKFEFASHHEAEYGNMMLRIKI